VPMLPTLVFTLVIAGILRDQYDIPSWLFGGLIVYAFITTVLPAVVTRKPPPDFTLPVLFPPQEGSDPALSAGRPAAPDSSLSPQRGQGGA